ncbi:tyrosine--tRNA ligase [bacterium]|nr:tyrosine--tRNA ligase [bacterium]
MTADLTLDAGQQKEFGRQWAEISRGTVALLPEEEFKEKLRQSIVSGTPLRVKQGFDPTSPDIHIGHTVGLRKLKQFQDLGHQIVLIVGDYTALVGDPSERSSTRPMISYDEIMKNAETYQDQFFRVLDRSKTEVRSNGEWFKGMGFHDVMQLAGKFTVARLLERDDFTKRMKAGTPISIHELFYPLMQAYDSVAIRADIEIGATEQTFNLLAGRTIQEAYGVPPQVVLTLPILIGLDGVKKMSKSLGNYIGIEEPPREIFGKVMSIPDELIYSYFELATDVSLEELAEIKRTLDNSSANPMETKKQLGVRLVDMYHAAGSGAEARAEFERIFSKGQLPDDMPEMSSSQIAELGLDPEKLYLVGFMTKAGLSKSNGEARKLIAGGGVSIDGEKVSDADFEFAVSGEMILKVGKRRFLKLLGD